MTDHTADLAFLDTLETRCKQRAMIVLSDEMERLQVLVTGTIFTYPTRPCTKPALVMAQIKRARERLSHYTS